MPRKIETAAEAWELVSEFYDHVYTASLHAEPRSVWDSGTYDRELERECEALSLKLGVKILDPLDEPPTGICILLELLAEAEVIDYRLFREMCQTIEAAFPASAGRHVWRRNADGARERAIWAKLWATKALYSEP